MRKRFAKQTYKIRKWGSEKTTKACDRIAEVYIQVRDWIMGKPIMKTIDDIVKKNRILAALAVFAITSSLVGYTIGGLPFFNALYAAAALFFVNPVDDSSNVLIMIGKYLSLIATAGVVLSAVSFAFKLVSHHRINRNSDSTAVYTDNPWGKKLVEELRHGYISARNEYGGLESAKHHIFMYTDDMANQSLYAAHRKELEEVGARAYIMLNHTDAFLLRSESDGEHEGPHYFNLYDMMARDYWREHSLYQAVREANGETIKVAIIGYDEVGQAICKYAVLNNVYRLNQAIEYHVWGCKPYQAAFLEGINLMFGDRIIAEKKDVMDDLRLIASMHRVIITYEDNNELLQQLLHIAPNVELHCYNDSKVDLSQVYAHSTDKLVSFGNMEMLLTEENIKQEPLYKKAKLLNYDYVLQLRAKEGKASKEKLPPDYESDMDSEWRKLSGFHKGSNIARADHLGIEVQLREELITEGMSKEETKQVEERIGELEHYRWCRFHFYNHWSYDPGLGDKKDAVNRKHGLLGKEVKKGQEGKDKVFNDMIRTQLNVKN